MTHVIGEINEDDFVRFNYAQTEVLAKPRTQLLRWWSETSYHMQSHRDNAQCAQQEYDLHLDAANPGLFSELSFDVNDNIVLVCKSALR